jgi:predicted transcriptional regulator
MSIALSFRTEEETRQALDRVAAQMERNRNWVINQAIQDYLDLQAWQLEQIEKGIADRKAGRVHTHEEVVARIQARIAAKAKTKGKAKTS